jgi:hypothetical protein
MKPPGEVSAMKKHWEIWVLSAWTVGVGFISTPKQESDEPFPVSASPSTSLHTDTLAFRPQSQPHTDHHVHLQAKEDFPTEALLTRRNCHTLSSWRPCEEKMAEF